MASLVGGFLLPHDPLIFSAPDAPGADIRDASTRAFAEIARRIRELEVDTIITVGADHYRMFGPHCVPQCLIGIGDVHGPAEPGFLPEQRTIPAHPELASHLLREGIAQGIAWSFSKDLLADHATFVPYLCCYEQVPRARVIPVYLNEAVAPVLPNRLVRSVGESIRAAVQSWPGAERVAVVGTGGCSHWVGAPGMGSINSDLDDQMLALVRKGDLDALCALSDDMVLKEAGNGALEYKNWICAMAATQARSARLIYYKAVPQWVAGVAFAELN